MQSLVIILSPHLDDAVLSCGILIQRIQKEGHLPVIITVFTVGGEGNQSVYEARRKEDKKAALLLNAKTIHLGFKDAPFRSKLYKDFSGITFGTDQKYNETVQAVAKRFRDFKNRFKNKKIIAVLAPLAIGNHVDHRITRAAALLGVSKNILFFYEDRPYSFLVELIDRVLGVKPVPPTIAFWKRYFAMPYVKTYLGNTRKEEVISSWAKVKGFPSQYKPRRMIEISPTPEEARLLVSAIQAYESQWRELFQSKFKLMKNYQSRKESYYGVSQSAEIGFVG